MALPTRIPILHEPDYRTKTIGTFRDGQFFADVTGAFGFPNPELKDTVAALIHVFDHEGVHVRSVIETGFRDGAAAHRRCAELIAELADPVFGNIAIGLFEVWESGIRWGLVDRSDEEWDRAVLVPEDLSFTEPWNGLYDT